MSLELLRKMTIPMMREESRTALHAQFGKTNEDIGLDSPELLQEADGIENNTSIAPTLDKLVN